ncbi:MAG: DUF883 domain-containing protein [Proteobacteria bacterium]|nr:DUF883 domain-containing protein [Pseudomonadota bacterium]
METTSSSEKIGESLAQTAGEAESLLKRASEATSREVNSALKRAAEQLRRAQTEFLRLEELAVDRAKDAAKATDHAVHEHPYAAMGVAAALGVLVGMLISRRD